jgi:lipopolysaccharide transport system ATP-binding protein
MSGEENAITAGIIAGLTRRQVEARLDRIAAFAELEEHMDQPMRTYSDGMRTRLAFAVAVSIDPAILLIDEILAVGDLRFQQRCLQRIEELRDGGVTILLTSHVVTHVKRICSRSIWLQNGLVRLDGPTEQVMESYENMMRRDLPAPEELAGGGMRIGTRRVEIVEARLLDRDGAPSTHIAGGAPVAIEMDYRAHERVPDAIVSVTLHEDGSGTPVVDVNTDAERVRVGELGGEGTLRLDLERLDLAPGIYHLDVGLYGAEWTEVLDYLWQAHTFEVVGDPAEGPLAPPRSWTVR